MSEPHAYFRVQLGRCPDDAHDFSFVVPISEVAVHDWLRPVDEFIEPVDRESGVANLFVKLFVCTPPDVIAKVKEGRERIAKMIANEFIKAIEQYDTIMGDEKSARHPRKP